MNRLVSIFNPKNRLSRLVTVMAWITVGIIYLQFIVHILGNADEYDAAILCRAMMMFDSGKSPYLIRGYVYPPSNALALFWLGYFKPNTFQFINEIFDNICYFGSLVLCFKITGISVKSLTAPLIFLLLYFSHSYRGEMRLGNLTALIVLLLCLQIYFITENMWTTSAILFSVSLLIKPMLISFILLRHPNSGVFML